MSKLKLLPILDRRFCLQSEHSVVEDGWKHLIANVPRQSDDHGAFSEHLSLRPSEEESHTWILGFQGQWEAEIQHRDPNAILAQIEQYVCGEAMRQSAPEVVAVHGALVASSSKGVLLLLGRSRSGKSTLGVSLWENGWDLLSDDRCLLKIGEGGMLKSVPIPRRVSLRPDCLDLIHESTRRKISMVQFGSVRGENSGSVTRHLFYPDSLREPMPSRNLSVLGIVILSGKVRSCLSIERLNLATAARDLLQCTTRREYETIHEQIVWWGSHLGSTPVFRIDRSEISLMRDRLAEIASEVSLKQDE